MASLYDLFGARATTLLADLGPLPEVVESSTDTAWQMFVGLQTQQAGGFADTQPWAPQQPAPAATSLSVQDVMVEARRLNRVCPMESTWEDLCARLHKAAGAEPPPPILSPEWARTPPLVKRTRLRDQVEWCEQHGLLPLIYEYIRSLAEEDWSHIKA
jgi:hypothetical protein